MKNKNFLRSLKLITTNRDFKLGPIIKIDQNFDLVKLNRKESHMKKIGLLITLISDDYVFSKCWLLVTHTY